MRQSSAHEIVSDGLRAALKRLSKRRGSKEAAVAYVTSETDVPFGNGDVLVCDASNPAIASGQTDASILQKAFERGAELFSLPGLHAKLMIFGKTVVIGSANLSGGGLTEAALITSDHVIRSGVASLIYDMAKHADTIDEKFLDRIAKIVVKRTPGRGKGTVRKLRLADRGSRTWLIGVKELDDDAFSNEDRAVERGMETAESKRKSRRSNLSWIRFVGNSAFRRNAREGDTIIQIWTGIGLKRPRVLGPAAICFIQPTKAWTRFYVECIPGTSDLSWSQFSKLARTCGLKRFGKRSTKVIAADSAEEISRNWSRAKKM